ncbi:hypothetical protein ACFP3Q_17945 [Nocardioides sp. GCM10027113]|uniref:hypothetical protein n=1 Tax=unclassified Nocardioides TaxID=2615069 RepID=UPI003612A7FD
MSRMWTVASAALLVLTAGGCGDESVAETEEQLAEQQELVLAEMTEAVEAVDAAGLEVVSASGYAEYCRMPPDEGAYYRAGARVAEDGDPAGQVAAIRDALTELGWTVEGETVEPEPSVSLARGDLRAGISLSRSQVEPGVTFGVKGDCFSVNDEWLLEDDLRTDINANGD